MYRRLGYFPTETSEHSSEYVPWYLHHDAEIDRLRIPVGDYLRISADNVAEYHATRAALLRRRAARPAPRGHRVRAAGHPQHGHRHDAPHPRQRAPTTA